MSDYDGIAEEVEGTPPWVDEGTEDDDFSIAGEDIHAAEQIDRSDVIEPAKGVEMIIKKVDFELYTPPGKAEWRLFNLKPMMVVTDKGVDGKGRYKNKHFFPRILAGVNRKAYDFSKNAQGKATQYYEPSGSAFGDYNAFLRALGFPTNPAPLNDAAFRKSLVGRRVLVDITKEKRQAYDSTQDKYVNTDEYENKLIYRGQPKAAPAPQVAEAAVS